MYTPGCALTDVEAERFEAPVEVVHILPELLNLLISPQSPSWLVRTLSLSAQKGPFCLDLILGLAQHVHGLDQRRGVGDGERDGKEPLPSVCWH